MASRHPPGRGTTPSQRCWLVASVAAAPGFEPELRDPKSLVLPLHYAAVVPRAGLEPARALHPMVFETIASTIPPPRHSRHSLSARGRLDAAGGGPFTERDQLDPPGVGVDDGPAVAVEGGLFVGAGDAVEVVGEHPGDGFGVLGAEVDAELGAQLGQAAMALDELAAQRCAPGPARRWCPSRCGCCPRPAPGCPPA